MSSMVQTTAHAGKPPKGSHVKQSLLPEAQAELAADIAYGEPAIVESEAVTGFDYDSILEPELRQMALDAAQRIAENNREVERRVLDTGRTLMALKEAIKSKGKLFGDWIEAACPFSYKTALNYMAVAREFGDDYHLLTYIPAQTLYPLASGKGLGEARNAVLDAAKNGSPLPVLEVEKLISQPKVAVGDGGDKNPLPTDKTEVRRSAAAKAIAWLEKQDDYSGFLALVREAGREFIVALSTAAKEAA